MADALSPQLFDSCVRAANIIARKNSQLGLTIGNYVRNLVLLKISAAIKEGKQETKLECEEFQFLYDTQWNSTVSSTAGRRQRLNQLNSSQQLPLTEDLETFSKFLYREIASEKDPLRSAKLCLTKLILFNKRRPMEVAEVTKEAYLTTNSQNDNQAVSHSLTEAERIVSER